MLVLCLLLMFLVLPSVFFTNVHRKMQLLFIEHDFRLGLGLFLSQGDFTGSRLQAQLPVGGP